MKNHWIKRREDFNTERFNIKLDCKAVDFEGNVVEPIPESKGRFCVGWWVGDGSKVRKEKAYVQTGKRILTSKETNDLYGNHDHCKCKSFRTNMGHTEKCLKELA